MSRSCFAKEKIIRKKKDQIQDTSLGKDKNAHEIKTKPPRNICGADPCVVNCYNLCPIQLL
jgi:hypothetical protein